MARRTEADRAAGSRSGGQCFPVPLMLLVATVGLPACGADGDTAGPGEDAAAPDRISCTIPDDRIHGSGGRGGIPALTNPSVLDGSASGPTWLEGETRVVGVATRDTAIAVPMNILWYHEVVNLDLPSRPVTVSHCPLTGSTLVFDRSPLDGKHFVVSGLVYMSNLVMSTRETGESLMPQMEGGFRCGPRTGLGLLRISYLETTWRRWRELRPGTTVLSAQTGYDRNYPDYPYGGYRDPGNSKTAFPVPEMDPRRQPKEEVLGFPSARRTTVGEHEPGGLAVPLAELEELGRTAAVEVRAAGQPYVVFWDSTTSSARAFRPEVDEGPRAGLRLRFDVRQDTIRDRETGSAWRLDGVAAAGELQGARLERARKPYLAFWFAWALFQPATGVWEAPVNGG